MQHADVRCSSWSHADGPELRTESWAAWALGNLATVQSPRLYLRAASMREVADAMDEAGWAFGMAE